MTYRLRTTGLDKPQGWSELGKSVYWTRATGLSIARVNTRNHLGPFDFGNICATDMTLGYITQIVSFHSSIQLFLQYVPLLDFFSRSRSVDEPLLISTETTEDRSNDTQHFLTLGCSFCRSSVSVHPVQLCKCSQNRIEEEKVKQTRTFKDSSNWFICFIRNILHAKMNNYCDHHQVPRRRKVSGLGECRAQLCFIAALSNPFSQWKGKRRKKKYQRPFSLGHLRNSKYSIDMPLITQGSQQIQRCAGILT